ncbi:MAG TPA: hypothetical protein VIL07_09355 [Symbiobacteriaceae bacterium]
MAMPDLGETAILQPGGAPAVLHRAPAREAAGPGVCSLSARRMAQLRREWEAVYRAWNEREPHLPPRQLEEVAARATEVLRNLEELRRMIEGTGA